MNLKIVLLIIVLFLIILIIGGYFLWQYIYWDIGYPFPKPPKIPLIPKCSDTDGGKNPTVFGKVSLIGEKNTEEDFCVKKEYDENYHGVVYKQVEECSGEDCFIQENFCADKDKPTWNYIPCPLGCNNRACVNN